MKKVRKPTKASRCTVPLELGEMIYRYLLACSNGEFKIERQGAVTAELLCLELLSNVEVQEPKKSKALRKNT